MEATRIAALRYAQTGCNLSFLTLLGDCTGCLRYFKTMFATLDGEEERKSVPCVAWHQRPPQLPTEFRHVSLMNAGKVYIFLTARIE